MNGARIPDPLDAYLEMSTDPLAKAKNMAQLPVCASIFKSNLGLAMLSFDQFREQFTKNVVNHPLWVDHPYFRLLKTNSTTPILKEWMIQGGKIEQTFPTLLRTALDNDAIPASLKVSIRENLADEIGHGEDARSHFTLYKEALQALDLSFSDYENTQLYGATEVLLRGLLDGVASQDPIEAVARLTTEELLPPVEFPAIVRALVQTGHEGNQGKWAPYFAVHIEGDRKHADAQIENLFRLIDNDDSRLRRALDVQQRHLAENVAFYDWLLKCNTQQADQSGESHNTQRAG